MNLYSAFFISPLKCPPLQMPDLRRGCHYLILIAQSMTWWNTCHSSTRHTLKWMVNACAIQQLLEYAPHVTVLVWNNDQGCWFKTVGDL